MSAFSQRRSSGVDLEILEVFHRLTLELAGQRDPQEVLRNALESALTLCGGDAGAVYLVTPDGAALQRQFSVGATVTSAGARLLMGEGVTGAAVQQGRALLVGDYQAWLGRSAQYGSRQRSVMAAPLHRRGAVIGALMVVTENVTDAYDETDLKLLERFAAFSSVILENARLNQSLELERARAEDRAERRKRVQSVIARAMSESEPLTALTRLVEGCGEALACSGGAYLVAQGQEELQWLSEPLALRGSVLRVGEGLIGGVAATGETILVNDYPNWEGRLEVFVTAGVKSVIAAPLRRGSEVIGVVFLEHHERTHYFLEDDLELLSQVAVVASAMLEQARLFDSMRGAQAVAERRSALLEATHEFNLELGGQPALSALLNLLLQRATVLLGGNAGGVYLVEGEEIQLVASLGDELVPRAPLGYGVSGGVAQSGEAMLLEDYSDSAFYDEDQPGVPWRAVMSVPLRRGASTIGVLTVVDTRRAARFDGDDLEALERFAALGSLAIENTTLLEATQLARDSAERERTLLEALSETSLELVARLEPGQMLQQLTRRTATLFDADAAAVYLVTSDGQRFERVAWYGESPSKSGRFNHGLSGRVMGSGSSLRIDDYLTWEGNDLEPDEIGRWHAAMSAPLHRGSQVIGALTIARTESFETFSPADLEALERFAAFASLTLEKAQLLEDTRRAERDAVHRLEQLEALDAVSLQLLEQRQPVEVLQRTLRLLMPLVGATAGGYWRYYAEDSSFELTLGENIETEFLGTRQGLHDGLCGEVLQTGAAMLLEDYQSAPRRNSRVPEHYRSAMLAPLVSSDQVNGVLFLAHDESHRFTPSDLETVKRFTALAGVALENARLLEGMRRAESRASDRNALLETLHGVNLELGDYVRLPPLLFSILERATRMLGGHDGRLYLREPDKPVLKLAAHIGGVIFEEIELGVGVSGQVALSGTPMVVDDYLEWPGRHTGAQRWRSVISVPLKRGSQVLGSLTVVDIQTPARFTALDLEALERFAALASLALQKAQLLEDARNAERAAAERARQLEALHGFSLELNGQLEPERLMSSILVRASQLLEANAGGVYLNDPTTDETVLTAALERQAQQRVRLGTGVSGRVAQSGEPHLIDDYQTWAGRIQGADRTWRSVASVPLKRGESIIGALTIADTTSAGRFTNADLEVLTRFASLASVALENARLYLRERQNLSDERVRLRITQRITRLRRVPDAAQALLETLSETLGYRHLTLYLLEGERFRLQAHLGHSTPLAEIPLTRGVTGRVARSGKAELVIDAANDPDFLFDTPELNSMVCLPLLGRDGVMGTLNIEGTHDHPMRAHDLELLGSLASTFSTALENATLHEQLERKAQELNFLRFQAERAARYDPLTNLRNRRAFEEDLNKSLERFRSTGHAFSLAVVDLAGFKAVNDSLGHAAGDEALRRIARVLGGRSGGVTHRAYRAGGDEFLLLMPSPKQVDALLHGIIHDVETLEFEGGLRITPNIGVATFPGDADNLDRLQSLADKRMYAAKAAGVSILEGDALENPPAPKRRADDQT